jgi:hypothetical protein
MRISRVLTAKAASINGTEFDLITTIMFHYTLMITYVASRNTIHCYFRNVSNFTYKFNIKSNLSTARKQTSALDLKVTLCAHQF